MRRRVMDTQEQGLCSDRPPQHYARTVGGLASLAARALGLRAAPTPTDVSLASPPGEAPQVVTQPSVCLVWQTDAAARLQQTDPALARALRLAPAGAGNDDLPSLLDHCSPASEDRVGIEALRSAMVRGQPFAGLQVALPGDRVEAAVRWWSFSGQPLRDAAQRLLGWQGVVIDVTQARTEAQALLALAHRDKLTGLAKRHQLDERLADMAAADPHDPTPALVFFDLDHFKNVNDTLGHAAGDALLSAVGARLPAALGPTDLAVRLGGDEFAALVDDVAHWGGPLALGQRLLAALCQPVQVAGRSVSVSVSIGIALPDAGGCTATELKARADLALYAAKQAGRGCYRVFDAELQGQRQRRRQLECRLTDALTGLQVQLLWQPAVRIDDWRVAHLSAQPHWQHPTLGAVSEAELQMLAEQTGLLPMLSAWLLGQVCTEAAGLVPAHNVAVRATAAQLRHPDFAPAALRALGRSGLAPQRLRIAISEAHLDNRCLATRATLRALHAAGVQLALEDFSGGPGALLALQHAGFHVLCIAPRLLQALQRGPQPAAVLRHLFGMARAFGMHTVATDVDDQQTVSLLQRTGCHALQGGLLGPPMPLPVLARRIGELAMTRPRSSSAAESAIPQQARSLPRRQAGRAG